MGLLVAVVLVAVWSWNSTIEVVVWSFLSLALVGKKGVIRLEIHLRRCDFFKDNGFLVYLIELLYHCNSNSLIYLPSHTPPSPFPVLSSTLL